MYSVRCIYSRWRLPSNFKKFRYRNQHSFSFFCTTTDYEKPTQPAPPPIRVGLTESAGRAVFATRRIGAGELIHTAKPTIAHPSLSKLNSVCYFCLRRITSNSTDPDVDSCNVRFCSEECNEKSKVFHDVEKRADWSAFNDYCRSQGLKFPLLVKRLACMVMSGGANAESIDILQPANLSPEAISKWLLPASEPEGRRDSELIYKMEEGFDLLSSTFKKADVMGEKMAFLNLQWYVNVLARIRINAFRIDLLCGSYEDLLSLAAASVESDNAVGTAVYMLPSFYNHDCDPNAHIVWIENADARLKALRDVEEGEELRICYIDASMGRDARQNILAQGFGFQCNCLRCLSGD